MALVRLRRVAKIAGIVIPDHTQDGWQPFSPGRAETTIDLNRRR
jgi:hypothetical protein